MSGNNNCGNTVCLNAFLRKQEELEQQREDLAAITDQIVDEQIIDTTSEKTKAALELCQDEWFELMDMLPVDLDQLPVHDVTELAILAQQFKTKLESSLKELVEDEANKQYADIYTL